LWSLPAAGFVVGYYFRPLDPLDPKALEEQHGIATDLTLPPDMPGGRAALRAAGGELIWAPLKALHTAACQFMTFTAGSICKLWMDNLGTFEFVGDDEEQLHAWIKDTDGRRYGRPLITVLNHHSCVDEPFVVGRMTPISTLFWPSGSFFGPNAGVEIGMPPGMLFDGLTRTQLRSVVRSASDFASNERAQAAVAAAAAADEALDSAAAASTSMPAPAPDASTAAYASRKVLSIPAFGAAMRELQLSRGPKEMEPVTKWRAGRGNMRFTVCTREICFGTPVLSTVFSIGRGNAVMREAGIDQASLAWFQAHADAGHWTQIFPEARTWQEGGTPLRDDEGRWTSNGGRLGKPYSGVGPFKRGVGKVVANARITPVVVPLFHQGMATVLPQEPNNDVDSFVPV
jgi:hypothetical protein